MFTQKYAQSVANALALLLVLSLSALAQDFRGAISGRITESSGAAVANATVNITNTATNVNQSTTTNESGDFNAPYLIPGKYRVTVESKGFKKAVRDDIEVRVGDRLQLDLQLEVGAVSETVNITTDAPLLETTSASAGQVIDQRRISELPLSDGNPFVLSRLAPGITYTGDLRFSRPFDNGGTSGIVADGAPGRNEFTLDGTPNMASGGGLGRVAFVPPADAVQEFKVETAAYDGQTAHTAGATVNVTLKSGTNKLHGTIYEFLRNDKLSANTYFLNRTNLAANPARDADRDGKADRDPLRYNRYGFTVGGPIWIPKVYNGKDKSFFFFAFEGLKDVFPEPGLYTVPTEAQRTGSLAALLGSPLTFNITTDGNCAGVRGTTVPITNRDGSAARANQIYDPATAQTLSRCNPLTGRVEARVERLPFANNVIPTNRLSPIALNYLKYYPLPNQPGDSSGRNNFISGNPRTDNFHSESYRFDHTLTEKQRFFFRYSHNNRVEARGNWTKEVNGIKPTGGFLYRINDGGTFDHVYNFSSSVVLNSRVGFSRFNEPNVRQHEGAIDPASLGFASNVSALFGPEKYLPRFEIGNFSVIGEGIGGGNNHNIYSFQSTLTKIAGKHSLRMGYDFRSYRENGYGAGHAAGRYDFGTNFTRGPLDNSAGAGIGQELASFLLGQTTGGTIERNTSRSNQTLYNGMFVHDDFKVARKLTLNLGLRYEYESATNERYNRNIAGFDRAAASPIEAAAKTAYAAAPIPEIAASAFNVKGGLLFASDSQRSFWDADKNNFQPRFGFAYQWNEKTVVRGGWGIYTVPFVINGSNQAGFSQATPIVGSNDNGLTFVSSLANPFPSGVLAAVGSSLGLASQMGQGITFLPRDLNNTQAQRWSFGVQREMPWNWLIEAQYVGNRGYDGVVGTNILNTTPRQYLSTSNVRDQNVINFLATNVTNPLRNLIPGTGSNGATINKGQLLRPFPQFGTITTSRNDASSRYHAGQLRAERRFSGGYTALFSYTFSKFLERGSFLNEVDTEYESRLAGADVPHRFVMSGIWELPFGKGRKFGNDWNKYVNGIIGGWQVQGIGQLQSGLPIDMGNVYVNGDISKLKTDIRSSNVDGLTFDISKFYFNDATVQTNGVVDPAKQRADTRIQLANNIRVLPSRMALFRRQRLNLWDLSVSKNFAFTESIKLQLRGEFLNAFNKVIFGAPNLTPNNTNFGKVTGQDNLPRDVQIGLKLIF